MTKGDGRKGTKSLKGVLTIMIFNQLGKARRFTISSVLLLCASLFLVFYVVATIYFTNEYFDARRTNRIQAAKIAKLSSEFLKRTQSLERSKQRIALLDDYIRESKEQGRESTGTSTESPLHEIVDIEELEIKRDGSTIDVTFRIVNRQSNEESVEGYIFVLARIKDSDQPQAWVYPRSPLWEGLPIDYKSGHRFYIWNFMSISSELRLGEWIDEPLLLEILVYDRDGTLILKKATEVANAPLPF